MSMLIVGGLFGIALLAIIGVVLIVVSERNAMARAQVAKPAPAQAATKQDATLAAPNAANVEVASAMEDAGPTLNEQIYELSAQLHALHQQTQNLESRISTLMALVERFEYTHAIPVYNLMDEKLPLTPIPVE